MIYLSGKLTKAALSLGRRDLGVMVSFPAGWHQRAAASTGVPWAADNGCFSARFAFDSRRWEAHLRRMRPYLSTCLFAVLPDVVADAAATWERSARYMDLLLGMGYPPAYVSQDGETRWPVGSRCLFIGGTTEWKLSEASYALARKASDAGLWVHMGRVNSMRRITGAWVAGMDSADGTIIARAPDRRLPEVCGWLDTVNGGQQVMVA